MAIGVRILSDNLSGLTTNVTYLPISGGTIDLGVQTFPFNYISDYYFGTYNCYVPTYATMYSVVVPLPDVTPTPTTTQTPTPTNTATPSNTPSPVYERNLRTGGWYQNVCESVNMIANPANVKIFTTKPFDTLEVGDHVYGNKELTIAPIGANFTISDGAKFVQLSGTLIINVGVC